MPPHALGVLGALWLSAIVMSYLTLLLLRRIGRTDHITARSTHLIPTLRSGALGIVVLAAIGCVLSFIFCDQPLGFSLLFALSLAAIGLYDDFFPCSAKLRLALQICLCAGFVRYQVSGFSASALLASLSLTLIGVWCVNAANFMDGRNGLISGLMIWTLIALALLEFSLTLQWNRQALVYCALGALWLGFLPYNFPHAKMFMGDVGSYFAGALLVIGLVYAANRSLQQALAVLVLYSPILADASFTFLLRFLRRKSLFKPHREHLYQYLSRIGIRDVKLLTFFLVFSGACTFTAFLMLMINSSQSYTLFALHGAFCALFWLQLRRKCVRLHRERLQDSRARLELPTARSAS